MSIKQNNIPYLFLTIGDNGTSERSSPSCYAPQSTNPNNFAQDITTQNGKIHRFNIDGTIPFDNPVSNNSFYTRGHRNPQGLMYNPNLDIIYDIEHGDRTDDEINILHKGMNYGWKNVRGYHTDNSFSGEANYVNNYTPNPLISNDSLVEPLFAWCNTPNTSSNWTDWCTVAPSGGIYYGNNTIPQWQNSLLVVTLKDGVSTDKEIYQFKLEPNGKLTPSTNQNPTPQKFFGSDQLLNGRLRDIAISNDGKSVYLINNGGTTADKITVYKYQPDTVINGQINIELYTNPTSNIIKIKGLENYSIIKDFYITTMLGARVNIETENYQNIDISMLRKGIYFIHIVLEQEKYSLKFIKV